MEIITLIENLVTGSGLVAEHGFSLFIDAGERKILFDTGQTGLFMQNADKLGVDIGDIDVLVISHGHYDHTGGMYPFLECNKKARVYAKEGIFVPKHNSKKSFIGTPQHVEALDGRLVYVDSVTEVVPGVFIMPVIPLYYEIDTNFTRLYTLKGESFYQDEFEDELFIVIRKDSQINIITACSHRGITNICKAATDYFKLPVNFILGGFNMMNCGTEQFAHITSYLSDIRPDVLGVCHCTGVEKYAELAKELDTKVFYNFTGNRIIL